MERIIDIYGSSAEYNDIYRPEGSWFGRVLLDENNLFEGIVENYYGGYFFLVFGELTDKKIELTKCTKEDLNLPQKFTAIKEGQKYYGDYSVTTEFASIPLGECHMSYLPAEKTREESDYEKRGIRNHINILKADLGNEGKQLSDLFTKRKNESAKKSVKLV